MGETKIGGLIPTELRQLLFTPEDMERLAGMGEVRWNESAEQMSTIEAIELLQGCTVGIGSWGTPWPDAELLEGCPELKLWVHVAGTVKRMFGEHLEGRDLIIATCAPAIAESVAEITLAQLIIGLRRTLQNGVDNRSGPTRPPANSHTLFQSTVGVVGASEVGRRVVRNLRPFGPRILLYDPFVSASEAPEMGAELVADLMELCRRSDAVTLHTPPLPSTEKLLRAEHFQVMADDAVFINTSRGICLDEQALIAELAKGRLFAFLDVSAPEPAAVDSPLRTLPNVVYTSHLAGGKDGKIGRQAVDDIAAFLAGGQPLRAVTADKLDRMA